MLMSIEERMAVGEARSTAQEAAMVRTDQTIRDVVGLYLIHISEPTRPY